MRLDRVSLGFGHMIAALVVMMITFAIPDAAMAVSAAPSPASTPSVGDPAGCDDLAAYFAAANALTAANEGLAILETVDQDVLALTDEEAAKVVASLDELLVAWDALTPPPAAQAWQIANRDLFAWYREMTANRSHLDHQRLINGDRTIVPALGRATIAGQQACGYQRWNSALATAPSSTPVPYSGVRFGVRHP